MHKKDHVKYLSQVCPLIAMLLFAWQLHGDPTDNQAGASPQRLSPIEASDTAENVKEKLNQISGRIRQDYERYLLGQYADWRNQTDEAIIQRSNSLAKTSPYDEAHRQAWKESSELWHFLIVSAKLEKRKIVVPPDPKADTYQGKQGYTLDSVEMGVSPPFMAGGEYWEIYSNLHDNTMPTDVGVDFINKVIAIVNRTAQSKPGTLTQELETLALDRMRQRQLLKDQLLGANTVYGSLTNEVEILKRKRQIAGGEFQEAFRNEDNIRRAELSKELNALDKAIRELQEKRWAIERDAEKTVKTDRKLITP